MAFHLRFDPLPLQVPSAGGDDVTLTLREATAEDTVSWVLDWRPRFRASSDPSVHVLGDWPVPEHFAASRTDPRHLCLVASRGDHMEAFISLTLALGESRLVPGASMIYVEYILIGPNNLPPPTGTRFIQGLGTKLVSAAAKHSRDMGFGGRIGLHSKPDAENFYRRLQFTEVGMEEVDDGTWLYFELTPEIAAALIKRG